MPEMTLGSSYANRKQVIGASEILPRIHRIPKLFITADSRSSGQHVPGIPFTDLGWAYVRLQNEQTPVDAADARKV